MRKNLFIVFAFLTINSFSQTTKSFFFARTTGPLPFLEYGIGEDRLGGAKMTYLDSNILVRVIDSFKTDYIIQLSKNHTAYIDKKSVMKETSATDKIHVTNNWKVYGDSLFDYVNVSLDEKLPYRTIQQINPSRVVVEIFGTQSNTNWITQISSTKEIKNTWYEQEEDDVMKVIIDLKHKQHWGHSISYEGNKMVIKIKRQPVKPELRYMTIAVDAGHGGENTGAGGVTSKVLEKTYTLLIAKQLQAALLKKKAKVVMTRTIDTTLSMPERTEMLKNANPNMLISIHLNSASKDSVQGVSTYYRYIGFRPLSTAILKHMLTLNLKEYGNVGAFNFSLSGPTDYPNCLVEVAFLSNKEDEKKILSPIFHKAVAKKIVEGIEDFLKNL
ncbi:MAG TPA: N-acetylmuramoyl-L-alanine amidase [Chitinophagaceae bacterium]|nr:N-acetylmuramoyl-L-alanine amidase [Chitinophagaceae bacterium]